MAVCRSCGALPAGFKLRRQTWFFVSAITARLEALAALRRLDELEETVRTFSRPKTVLEAFALRALGVARPGRRLLAQAVEMFEGFGLDWHAEGRGR